MKRLIFLFILFLYISAGCGSREKEMIRFPYSQWTVGFSGHKLYWSFSDSLIMNASFISQPDKDWEAWYKDLREYRDMVHDKMTVEEPSICGQISSSEPGKVHFDKIGYDLDLKPGEQLNLYGEIKSPETRVKIKVEYELKTRSGELSYIIRKKINNHDSVTFFPSDDPQFFSLDPVIPEFNTDSFSITPVVLFEPLKNKGKYPITIENITPEVEFTSSRLKLKEKIDEHLQAENNYPKFKVEEELLWMNDNYVMGFAFLWDNDIWDFRENRFRIQYYCDKMEEEFGGINSVIFWHSYPNLGIDQRNQFDFLYDLPGGLEGFRKVVSEFHNNNVKVFITYNPWDLDTRRPENSDARELAKIIDYCDADGIFLDTWNSAVGGISVFSHRKHIKEEIEKTDNSVALVTEIFPDFKDLTGINAINGSWGQEILPFHYSDLSHIKWILPWHKQYFIKRMKQDRKKELSHAWINGQGIMVWENIFGTMNPWRAGDRQILRKMKNIWDRFGYVYLTPDWQPFIPTNDDRVLVSSWNANGFKIWNIVNTSDNEISSFQIQVDTSEGEYFYDLWNGAEIYPDSRYNNSYFDLRLSDFSCLLQTDSAIHYFHNILAKQQMENIKEIPGITEDRHIQEQSIKEPVSYSYSPSLDSLLRHYLLFIPAGKYHFNTRHIWREGQCYPDMDAADNHDLKTVNKKGYLEVIHSHTEEMNKYHIMPEVVTNAEFELFLDATGYSPEHDHNFLKHWNGRECPDEIKNEPVVYVSLEDARAFADWAGMQLPTEWQWQKAAEYHPRDFMFNRVFEWNESERFDGHNRFVNLRGGSSSWSMPSSWWYFPGSPYGETTGGVQPYNSHVKYFLMYPGLDRASTIGFRCVWEPSA